MRNYEQEIQELTRETTESDLRKTEKETKLRLALIEREHDQKARATKVMDGYRFLYPKVIGLWPAPKNLCNEGDVVNIRKWVSFGDISGVKQVKAPNNLLVDNDDRKYPKQHMS